MSKTQTSKRTFSSQLTSFFQPFSGDSLNYDPTDFITLKDPHPSNTDSVSTTKNASTEVVGDLWTQNPTTKTSQHQNSHPLKHNPPTLRTTLTSQLQPQTSSSNANLRNWLRTFPPTYRPTSDPVPSPTFLRWLLQCYNSNRLPQSLQQQYWAELLDLEYLEEVPSPFDLSDYPLVDLLEDLQEAEDLGAVAALLLGEEDPLEEGEIPVIPEEEDLPDPLEEDHLYHLEEPLEEGEITN